MFRVQWALKKPKEQEGVPRVGLDCRCRSEPLCLGTTSQVGMETNSSLMRMGWSLRISIRRELLRSAAWPKWPETVFPLHLGERILKVHLLDGGGEPLLELRLTFEIVGTRGPLVPQPTPSKSKP